jgi:hypothetical protein
MLIRLCGQQDVAGLCGCIIIADQIPIAAQAKNDDLGKICTLRSLISDMKESQLKIEHARRVLRITELTVYCKTERKNGDARTCLPPCEIYGCLQPTASEK